MPEQNQTPSQIPLSRGPTDPGEYESYKAKVRFAVAKHYGMGSDGRWKISEIAEALEVSERQVYSYLNDSQVGREAREAYAERDAEWRLEAALSLRKEVERLEETEQELLQRSTTVPTAFEEKDVEATPTADGQMEVSEESVCTLNVPVPTEHKEVTDYGSEIERVQKEKRRYMDQICKLLGLYEHDGTRRMSAPSECSERGR